MRSDRDEAEVSEYWYTMPWEDGYDPAECRHQDQLIERTVTDNTIDLVPICSGLEDTTAESAGRIVGTALNSGHFEDFGEISFIDRLADLNTKNRIVWAPDEPVRRDLRLFAFFSAPGEDLLPTGTWEWVDCVEDQCAQLTIDGIGSLVLGFTDDGTRYSLTAIIEF